MKESDTLCEALKEADVWVDWTKASGEAQHAAQLAQARALISIAESLERLVELAEPARIITYKNPEDGSVG